MNKKIKIAFTSCARYETYPDQPQWADIESANPDYLFLLGNHIHMDFGLVGKEHNGTPKGYSADEFRRIMTEKYTRQWNEPHFKQLFDKHGSDNYRIDSRT